MAREQDWRQEPEQVPAAYLVTVSLHAFAAIRAFVASVKDWLDSTAVSYFPSLDAFSDGDDHASALMSATLADHGLIGIARCETNQALTVTPVQTRCP